MDSNTQLPWFDETLFRGFEKKQRLLDGVWRPDRLLRDKAGEPYVIGEVDRSDTADCKNSFVYCAELFASAASILVHCTPFSMTRKGGTVLKPFDTARRHWELMEHVLAEHTIFIVGYADSDPDICNCQIVRFGNRKPTWSPLGR